GRVVEVGESGIVIESAAVGRGRAGAATGAKPGDTVRVALPPEEVRVLRVKPAVTQDGAGGVVGDTAYPCAPSVYNVAHDDGLVMHAAAANLTRLIERSISWDDRVWLTWDASAGIVLTQ